MDGGFILQLACICPVEPIEWGKSGMTSHGSLILRHNILVVKASMPTCSVGKVTSVIGQPSPATSS